MVVLSSVLFLVACHSSEKEEVKTSISDNPKSKIEPFSPITNECLLTLSNEVNQYWFIDGAYSGKGVTNLEKISWKKGDTTQCFTLMDKNEALFATTENGNIINARIYNVGKIDKNGFFPLTQTKSIVSQTYFNANLKKKKGYSKLDKVEFDYSIPNESYLVSTSNVSKKVQYIRFYNIKGVLYRENFSDGNKIILHRYSK